MSTTQDKQLAKLVTPLGKDKLLLAHMSFTEGLSELFEIRIECLSEVEANQKPEIINFDKLLGLDSHIEQRTVGNKLRYYSGKVVEASWFGERGNFVSYQLTLRPWLWFLTQMSGHRIFQNMTVLQILRKVFTDAGFNDFEFKVTETYESIEYCVQYRETHFDFVSRLMEQFGIYYFFQHSDSKHTLILADSKASHKPLPNMPTVDFLGMGERFRDTREYFNSWLYERKVRSGKVTVKSFDFDKPNADTKQERISQGGYAAYKDMEIYHYPNKYKQSQANLGGKFAMAKLHAAQGVDRRRYAGGDAPSITPGGLVKLQGHPTAEENQEYLVVQAQHAYSAQAYRSGDESSAGDSYTGHYVLQPSSRPYRAPQITPRPIIAGPQTAIVVGPKGEEIYTDKHGRIKVQFHWDREGKRDENSSRWVRVAQVWSGPKWGGFLIPRIGMEVIVEFIEGDPDRPLVIGTVYNGENKFPYDMPANKTQAGIKTRSSKGGGESDYNEFFFEDKKDSEFVRFHAQKDLDSTIENTEKRIVKGKEIKSPGKTTRETTIEAGDDVQNVNNGDNNVTISRDQNVKIKNNQTVDVTSVISVTAGQKIVFTVGQSTITMTPATIDIDTPSLSISTQNIKSDASVLMKLTGGMITLN